MLILHNDSYLSFPDNRISYGTFNQAWTGIVDYNSSTLLQTDNLSAPQNLPPIPQAFVNSNGGFQSENRTVWTPMVDLGGGSFDITYAGFLNLQPVGTTLVVSYFLDGALIASFTNPTGTVHTVTISSAGWVWASATVDGILRATSQSKFLTP